MTLETLHGVDLYRAVQSNNYQDIQRTYITTQACNSQLKYLIKPVSMALYMWELAVSVYILIKETPIIV